jgi:uncharacterized protein
MRWLALLLARRGDSVEVRYLAAERVAEPAAMKVAAVAYLPPAQPALAGGMCAAPTGSGFTVSFRSLAVTGVAAGG